MSAISNRFAPSAPTLPPIQALARRASAKPPAAAQPAPVVELKKPRATTTDPMLDLAAPPMLPATSVATPLPRDLGERLEVYASEMDGGAGSLAWAALTEMARSSTNDIHIAGEVRSAMQRGAFEAKLAELGKAEREQAHQRSAALVTLGSAVAVQAVACVLAAANPAAGMMVSNLGSSVTNAVTQNIGPARAAQRDKLDQMRQETNRQTFEMNVDSAKASYDEAKEQLKLAQRILSEHAERQTQIATTITRV